MNAANLLSYFGFLKEPFSKAILPADLFKSSQLNQVLKKFDAFLGRKGMALLTGDVGAGKTTAMRACLGTVDPTQYNLAYIDNPMIGAMGIFNSMATQLNIDSSFVKWQLVANLKNTIEKSYTEYKKPTIVIFDDAHLLSATMLEELRLLSNFGIDSKSPFYLVLMAQTPFRKRLQLQSLEAIAQRITIRVHFTGIEKAEIQPYIHHHLAIAGRTDNIFSDHVMTDIYQHANGLPRLINTLCYECLLELFIQDKNVADGPILQKVLFNYELG